MNNLLGCALSCAAQGWAVFPLVPMGKLPAIPKYKGGHGFHDAVKDGATIQKWWAMMPKANIGIATGAASGFWVLDADNDKSKGKDGLRELQALKEKHGDLPQTRMVISPRGGLHMYFAWDEFYPIKSNTSKLATGVDVRGDGGYVAVPDSERAEGFYLWMNDSPIVSAPTWLSELLMIPPKPAGMPLAPMRLSGSQVDRALGLLARLNPGRADDYQQWIEVGMSLFGLGYAGLQLWDDWSRRSQKYKQGECEHKWKSFDNIGISFGSLVAWANQDNPAIVLRSHLKRRYREDYRNILENGL